MPVFSYDWRAIDSEQRGKITVKAADPIAAVLFARREVRARRLPGYDLGRIELQPTDEAAATTGGDA